MGKYLGKPSSPDNARRSSFVQTEQSSHEAWAKLIMDAPKAGALMHFIVGRMDRSTNAVVASHSTLASIMGCSTRSIKIYLAALKKDKWIQQVSLGPGTVNAYVVNSVVAWGITRSRLNTAQFTAQVLAIEEDQDAETLTANELRVIPTIFAGEQMTQIEADPVEGDAHLQKALI